MLFWYEALLHRRSVFSDAVFWWLLIEKAFTSAAESLQPSFLFFRCGWNTRHAFLALCSSQASFTEKRCPYFLYLKSYSFGSSGNLFMFRKTTSKLLLASASLVYFYLYITGFSFFLFIYFFSSIAEITFVQPYIQLLSSSNHEASV